MALVLINRGAISAAKYIISLLKKNTSSSIKHVQQIMIFICTNTVVSDSLNFVIID